MYFGGFFAGFFFFFLICSISSQFLRRQIHHRVAAFGAGNSRSRSRLGFHSKRQYDLHYLTKATSTQCLLPDPDFKDRCLKAVAAVCFNRNECEICCQVSVTSCLPAVTQRGVKLCSRVFSLQKLFTLSPGMSRDTNMCVFTSLFFQGWLKVFQYIKDYFSVSGCLKVSEM